MQVEKTVPAGHFSRTFSAAHRVWNDESKCSNIHGHNYQVEVTVEIGRLNEQNFVAPFDAIKETIDWFDHALIIDVDDPLREAVVALGLVVRLVPGVPSTEFMAREIAVRIAVAVVEANTLTHTASATVRLRETAGIEASATATATITSPRTSTIRLAKVAV